MAIEGTLGAGGVADLVSALWQQHRTGILDLTAGGVDRKLAFSDGAVVYIVSPEAAERLPVRLLTKGLASKQALLEAGHAGPDLREELSRRGVLTPEAHDAELRELIAEVLTTIFPVTSGRWTFLDRPDLSLAGVLETLPMVSVLWAAARTCSAEFATGFVGDFGQRVTRAATDTVLRELTDLSAQEGYLVSRIDGYSSVNDLIGLSPVGRDGCVKLLLGLTCVGFTDVTGRPSVRLPRPTRTAARSVRRPAPAASTSARPAAPVASSAGEIATASATPVAEAAPGGIEGARRYLASIAGSTHYAALGVQASGGEADIRRAYYALARLYHPDRFARDLDAESRSVVEDLFARLSEAFAVVSDPEARKEYDDRLRAGAVTHEADAKPRDKKDVARESYEKGRALAAAGERGQALQFLEHAALTEPSEYEYRMALARLLMADSRTRKRAEQHLQAALKINETNPEAHYRLGMLYKAAGLKSRALEHLQAGLKWDATHEGILKELAELGVKGDAGRLGGLFGKKS